MTNLFLIFIGAGLGGILRYWASTFIYSLLGRSFPFGTLVVNITGSFLMGMLFVLLLNRFANLAPELRSLLLIGLLGGYTTFSSFSIETLMLFENGAYLNGMLNILLSVILCLAATWLGVIGGRQL